MTHSTNAIEVRYQDKLVGWLNGHDGDSKNVRSIVLKQDDKSAWIEPGSAGIAASSSKFYNFHVELLSWTLSGATLASTPPKLLQNKVARNTPPYAESFQDPARDCTCFTWNAIKLDTFEEYEWIFDHSYFVPIDGPLDLETTWTTITAPSSTRLAGEKCDGVYIDEAASLPMDAWELLAKSKGLAYSDYTFSAGETILPPKTLAKVREDWSAKMRADMDVYTERTLLGETKTSLATTSIPVGVDILQGDINADFLNNGGLVGPVGDT